MSAAASRLQSESLSAEQNESLTVDENENEGETLERLTDTRAYPAGPVIAVDLDDVLSQTNQVVADCKHIPFRGAGDSCTASFRAQRNTRTHRWNDCNGCLHVLL